MGARGGGGRVYFVGGGGGGRSGPRGGCGRGGGGGGGGGVAAAGRLAGGRPGGDGEGSETPFVVIAASDPANPYTLALENIERPVLSRPRGAGALLVTWAGEIALAVEGREGGRRISVANELAAADVTRAARALADYLEAGWSAARRRRPLLVEHIDGVPAAGSAHAEAFRRAGYRRETNGLRYWGAAGGDAT